LASLNRHEIIGKLGRDPELRTSNNGTKYLFISVATDDYVGKGTDGKGKYETTWHDVTIFGASAEFIASNAKKGSTVFVEGRVSKTKKEGTNEYSTKVIASNVQIIGESGKSTSERSDTHEETTKKTSKPAEQPDSQKVSDKAAAPDKDEDWPF
jgi:single-strand DNA-binding protein